MWKNGELVGEERRDDPRLLIFPMRHLDPMHYGALSGALEVPVPDPCAAAGAQLPAGLNALEDLDDPGEPGEGAA